jgi:hypothetical protein
MYGGGDSKRERRSYMGGGIFIGQTEVEGACCWVGSPQFSQFTLVPLTFFLENFVINACRRNLHLQFFTLYIPIIRVKTLFLLKTGFSYESGSPFKAFLSDWLGGRLPLYPPEYLFFGPFCLCGRGPDLDPHVFL